MSSRVIQVEVTGLAEVLQSLEVLKKASKRRSVLRQALRKASTPLLRKAKDLCPVQSGTLKKSLAKKIVTNNQKGSVVVIIGPRAGYKRRVKIKRGTGKKKTVTEEERVPARYGHLVEFGTVDHPAQSFLRKAWDTEISQARKIITEAVAEGIQKELAKQAKRGAKK